MNTYTYTTCNSSNLEFAIDKITKNGKLILSTQENEAYSEERNPYSGTHGGPSYSPGDHDIVTKIRTKFILIYQSKNKLFE